MTTIRIGNDIDVVWKIFSRNGLKFSLEDQSLEIWLISGPFKKQITDFQKQLRNEVKFSIDAEDITRLGVYKLLMVIKDDNADNEDAAFEITQVFQIVSQYYQDSNNPVLDGDIELTPSSILNNIETSTLEGASAYEIAVKHGYTGTEEEWLNDPVNGIKGNGINSVSVVGEPSTEDSAINTYRISRDVGDPFDFEVKNGKGIASIDQTDTSDVSDGVNKIQVTYSDNTKSDKFEFKNGTGISSISETPSLDNGGTNVVRINLSDGSHYDINIKNGESSAGFFATAALLTTAHPSPVVGDYAFVSKAGDGTFPAYIYVCATAGTWTNSGEEFTTEVPQVSVSQNTSTGGIDLSIGGNVVAKALNAGYQFKGIATPTSPNADQSPDSKVFWFASTPGTYEHFNNLVVADGEVAIFKFNGTWSKEVTGAATAAQVNELGQEIVQFVEFEGAGDTPVERKLHLIPNRIYIVRLYPSTWSYSGAVTKFLIRGFNGDTAVHKVISLSPEGTADISYTFKAVDCDYYLIRWRGDVGQSCKFEIEDVTDPVIFDASYNVNTHSYVNRTLQEAVDYAYSQRGNFNLTSIGQRPFILSFIDKNLIGASLSMSKGRRFYCFTGTEPSDNVNLYKELSKGILNIDFISNTLANALNHYGASERGGKVVADTSQIYELYDESQNLSVESITKNNLVFTYNNRLFRSNGAWPVALKEDNGEVGITLTHNVLGYRLAAEASEVVDFNLPVSSAGASFIVVSASENDKFIVSGLSTTRFPAWAFIDATGNVLSRADVNQLNLQDVIIAPASTKYLISNHNSNSPIYDLRKVVPEDKQITDVESALLASAQFTVVDNSYSKGAYGIKTKDTGPYYFLDINAPSTNTGFVTYVVPCDASKIWRITGEGGGICGLYAFVDENGVILDAYQPTTWVENLVVKTPTDAAYIVVNMRISEVSKFEVNTNDAVSGTTPNINLLEEYGLPLLDAGRAKMMAHNESSVLCNFAFVTDTHIAGNQRESVDAVPNVQLFREFINEGIVDFAVHGGDVYTAYMALQADAFTFIDDFIRLLGNPRCDVFYAKGNHDNNSKYRVPADMGNLDWEHNQYFVMITPQSFQEITESQWDGVTQLYTSYYGNEERVTRYQYWLLTQHALSNISLNPLDLYGGYFYKDIGNDIRVIVLNVYDTDNLENVSMTSTQRNWLSGVALDTTRHCIVFSHTAESHLLSILDDFVANGGKLIALINGHRHLDDAEIRNGYNIITVRNGYGTTAEISADGNNAFCFSIFSIDLANGKLYETRVGKGSDREFSF